MPDKRELREFYESYCERARQLGLTPRSFEWWEQMLRGGSE